MNQFRKPVQEPEPEPVKTPKPPSKKMAKLSEVFGIFSKEQVIKWMPFIFFLALLSFFYISNTYYAEKNIRQIDKINTELKELRTEYITSKSEIMFKSKQSEVAAQLIGEGVKESVVPPKKIIINTKE